jgi:hypothetical protein
MQRRGSTLFKKSTGTKSSMSNRGMITTMIMSMLAMRDGKYFPENAKNFPFWRFSLHI